MGRNRPRLVMFIEYLLPWLLLTCLSSNVAEDINISITLIPRDYVDPRTQDGFTCGIDKRIDQDHLIAECNARFILEFIDKTEDSNNQYRTKVFDIATTTTNGKVVKMMDQHECSSMKNSGLYSLFLAPPRVECNSQTFNNAKEAGKDYYPIYIDTDAKFEAAIKMFESDIENLKEIYGNQYPKLCGTRTPMSKETAQSRKDTLSLLFSFPYSSNNTRSIRINEELSCKSKNETENAFFKSEIFEETENVGFQNDNAKVLEFQGFFETQIDRRASSKAGIIFVETILGESGSTADTDDVVPYDSLLVFPKGITTINLAITIKIDNEEEEDETFAIEILRRKGKNNRLKRGGLQGNLKKTEVTLLEKQLSEPFLKDQDFLEQHVINNARFPMTESNTIREFYLKNEYNKRLGKSTIFLEMYETNQIEKVDSKNLLRAYYFPYKFGQIKIANDDIGWVDIPYTPESNEPKVAFTGTQNGCAMVAMEKKDDAKMFRVYHLQSPNSKVGPGWTKYMDIIKNGDDVGNEIGTFEWEEYGDDNLQDHHQGTNYLFYDTDGKWWYMSQYSVFDTSVDKKETKGWTAQEIGDLMTENQLYNGEVVKVTKLEVFVGRAPGKQII